MPTTIQLVWAQDRAGAIGRRGEIPWHVPEDMAHFREVTGTTVVVMGRKTWESLPQRFRPLPNRHNVVVTRSSTFIADGAEVVSSLEAALDRPDDIVTVMGGGEIYSAAMDVATHLRITEIDVLVESADAFAPEIDQYRWETDAEQQWQTSHNGTRYRFVDYRRHGVAR